MVNRVFWLFLVAGCLFAGATKAQELVDLQAGYTTTVGDQLRIPLRLHNTSDKAQVLVVRLSQNDLHSGQKGVFCLDKTCLEPEVVEFTRRLEPGETLNGLAYVIEPGLLPIQNSLKFEIITKGTITPHPAEYEIALVVNEKPAKPLVFNSKEITIQDVYPNPVSDQAFIDYTLHNEHVKAKVIVHNILGMAMGEYALPHTEHRAKIDADNLSPGVYFYTLYLDNNGVLTRKIIVRK
ncbi:MAG: T9SS type A sorting domain-containing protein [Cyclobacteriaceae bacterium]|jgi:hypothetical protein